MIKLADLLNEAVKLTDIESDVAALYAWDGIKTNYGPNTIKDYGQDVVDMAIKLAPKVLAYQKKLKSIGKDIKSSKEAEILKAMISSIKSNRLNANNKVSTDDLLFYEGASDLKVYHKSYTEAIQTAKEYALKRGYMVDDDDSFRKIGMGPKRPSEGKTNKMSVELTKGGKPAKQQLHIQVYGMKNGYELNCYIG